MAEVVIYTRQLCGFCTAAKRLLDQKGVAYTEHDATFDPGLRQDMTLDAALARCMELYEPVPVRTPEGELVGVVNPADLAAALQVEQA